MSENILEKKNKKVTMSHFVLEILGEHEVKTPSLILC